MHSLPLPRIHTEVTTDLGDWRTVGFLGPDHPPGSISDTTDGTRRLLLFGWREGTEPGVWESHGVDAESGTARTVYPERLDLLSDLSEPYEQTVTIHGTRMQVRITLERDVEG